MAINIVWDVLVTHTHTHISLWALLCEPFSADHVENKEMTNEDYKVGFRNSSNKIKAITNTGLRV